MCTIWNANSHMPFISVKLDEPRSKQQLFESGMLPWFSSFELPSSALSCCFILEFWRNDCPTAQSITSTINQINKEEEEEDKHRINERKRESSYFSVPCWLICSRRISSSWNSKNPYQKPQPKGSLQESKSETENGEKKWKPVESRKRCAVPSSWNLQWWASSLCPAFAFINYNKQYLLGAPPLLSK